MYNSQNVMHVCYCSKTDWSLDNLNYFYLVYLNYNSCNMMWLLGYSVAVGEFNGDDDEGKEFNHQQTF